MENQFLISETFLIRLYNSLTSLDVRGYDSMNTLVATVSAVEQIIAQGPYKPPVNNQEMTNEKAEAEE